MSSEFAIFRDIVGELLPLDRAQMQDLAIRAGVSVATLYNWRSGYVYAPRLNTLTKVAKALGYEIHLRRRKGRMRLVV